jgi:hypothetical protein
MENFYTTVRPFCKLGNFLGFFPFSFDGDVRKGNLIIKKVNLLQMAIAIAFLILMMVANSVQYKMSLINRDFFEYGVWSWVMSFSLPSLLIILVMQMTMHKKIKKFFAHMHACDEKFYKLGIMIDHARHRIVIILLSLLTVFVTVFNYSQIVLAQSLEVEALIQEFFFACYLLYECFIFSQFIIMAYLVRERFKCLQSYLL